MPLKLSMLQLLDAICDGEPRIRGIRQELRPSDAAAPLTDDHETGWRRLFTVAVLASLSVAPD
ncbi:hypothetical protein ACIBCA_24040 [Kitasatospora sp. NPDC051170]|uniref:hypothetical protein n=1 Tax=Kitasatospora sp. NPDC051170 TaxID=3364056 RepID=UPI0037B7F9A9